MKRTTYVLPIIGLLLMVNVLSISTVATASTQSAGAVSFAFDDGKQTDYDYAFPVMRSRGVVGTFYVITGDIRDFSGDGAYMTMAELQDLQGSGCEIASHSVTHPDFLSLSDSQIRDECITSQQVLTSYGLAVSDFAYPYGNTNDHVDSIVSQYYRSGRSAYADPYVMELQTSQFRLAGAAGEPGGLSQVQNVIDQVQATKGWAIIFFHDIVPNPSGDFMISVQDFTGLLDYILARGVEILTVNQALDNVSQPAQPETPLPPVTSNSINIGITMRPFGMTMQYTLDPGDTWTAPSQVTFGTEQYAFIQWSDGSIIATRTFTSGGNYEIDYA